MAPRKNPIKIFNDYPIPSAIGIIVVFVLVGYYIFQAKNAPPPDYVLDTNFACYPNSTQLNSSGEVLNKQKPIPGYSVYAIKSDLRRASFNITRVGTLNKYICFNNDSRFEYQSPYVIGKKY